MGSRTTGAGRRRIVVLGDTHVPDFAPRLPESVGRYLRSADLILHAGDVTSPTVLDDLAGHAPVHAALGNNDGPDVEAWGARFEVRLEMAGVRIVMLHDAGRREGRERRLTRRFPHADLIIFGHSHMPVDAAVDGVRLLNPGSPTWKRREPAPTIALVDVAEGRIRSRIVALPR